MKHTHERHMSDTMSDTVSDTPGLLKEDLTGGDDMKRAKRRAF